jgi:hypothetical protein
MRAHHRAGKLQSGGLSFAREGPPFDGSSDDERRKKVEGVLGAPLGLRPTVRHVVLLLVLIAPLALASTTEHLSWDGNTATLACPFAGSLLYSVGCPRVEQENATHMDLGADLTRIAGVLTFTPRTPAQDTMRLFIQAFDGPMRPPYAYREFSASRTIPFDVDILAEMPGADHYELSIHGDWTEARQGNIGIVAEIAQPFHVEMDLVR